MKANLLWGRCHLKKTYNSRMWRALIRKKIDLNFKNFTSQNSTISRHIETFGSNGNVIKLNGGDHCTKIYRLNKISKLFFKVNNKEPTQFKNGQRFWHFTKKYILMANTHIKKNARHHYPSGIENHKEIPLYTFYNG